MIHVAKEDFVQKAKTELSARVQHADTIAEQFHKSYSGYTNKTGRQKLAVGLLLILVVGLLICMPAVVELIHTLTEHNRTVIYHMFADEGKIIQAINFGAICALYCVSAFMVLYGTNIIFIHHRRISKIDQFVFRLDELKTRLNTKLDTIDDLLLQLENDIRTKDVVLSPEYNIDNELARYQKIANNYSKPDNTFLSVILRFIYWPTTILLNAAFAMLAPYLIVEAMHGIFGIDDLFDVILFIYVGLLLITFLLLHRCSYKSTERFTAFPLSIFSGPVSVLVLFISTAVLVNGLPTLLGIALSIFIIVMILSLVNKN